MTSAQKRETPEELNRKISEAKDSWIDDDRNGVFRERNWTGDESANAELLDEMPNPLLSKFDNKKPPYPWCCEPDAANLKPPTYAPQHLGIHADRKTAVALAWLKWKGV